MRRRTDIPGPLPLYCVMDRYGKRITRRIAARPAGRNLLLATLTDAARRRVTTQCEEVKVHLGDVICAREQRIRHVYFPTGAIISLLVETRRRPALEVALIGREGAWGMTLALTVKEAATRAVVLHSGSVLRMEEGRFLRELAHNPPLRKAVNRYLLVLMSQLAQMTACTHFHTVKARLARRLLMMRDGSGMDDFQQTQEVMAAMLGVRRVGVTRAAGLLQARHLLRYARGRVTILDARALGAVACSCYASARKTYSRVMRRRPRIARGMSRSVSLFTTS